MNGILVVNKDKGCTSRDVVNEICKIFGTKKVGHTGTLDPLATGVLVVAMGQALKVCELLTNHDKEYIAGVVLGLESDTLDIDGNILSRKNVSISREKIISVVNSFLGEYEQEVPIYSAVKVNGKKLYEYARLGIDVQLPKKIINIKDIQVIDDFKYQDGLIYFSFRCVVSKGTYIRSLIRDIGVKLGTCAIMNSLVRVSVGEFRLENSYSLNDIKKGNYNLISISDVFSNIPRIIVSDEMAFKVKNGVIIDNLFNDEMAFIFDKDGNLLALYKLVGNKCRPFKMF